MPRFIGTQLDQIQQVGQIDSLEFRGCVVPGLDFIRLITFN
jgi:hypothetical protein